MIFICKNNYFLLKTALIQYRFHGKSLTRQVFVTDLMGIFFLYGWSFSLISVYLSLIKRDKRHNRGFYVLLYIR